METNIANPEVIAELLMKTSHAHHASFAAINGEDPEWTKWDGDHMAVDMSTELGVTIRTEVLGGTLAELDEQQQAQVPDAQWPAYYAQVRAAELRPSELAAHFRSVKDGLFRAHPASPLDTEQQEAREGLLLFDYREEWSVLGEVDWREDEASFAVPLAEGDATLRPAADIRFVSPTSGDLLTLRAFWLTGYGGRFSCRSRTRRVRHRLTAAVATSTTRSKAPISGSAIPPCSTSTTPVTPRVRTTRAGCARWRRPRMCWMNPSRRVNGWRSARGLIALGLRFVA